MGRIVTELNSRGLGIGKEITKEGVNFLKKNSQMMKLLFQTT